MTRALSRSFIAVAVWVAVLASAGKAHAVPKSWIAATNENWSDGANWNPVGVPGFMDDVTIAGGSATVNMDTAVDVNSITVNGACTRLIRANPGATTIRIRGNLTLSPTAASGIFRLSTATTQIGGSLVRSNNNMALDSNGGVVIFNAASGSPSHTLNGATLENVIFNDGLVGYWNLDAVPFTDGSGYGNTGTLFGSYVQSTVPPTMQFTDAGGVSFNGATYISLGITNLPNHNAVKTISVWVNFSSAAATQSMVALTTAGNATKLGLGGGNVRVLRNSGAVLVQAAAPSAGAWHHIAYTLSGTMTHTLYIDGVATTASTATDAGAPTAAFAGATTTMTERLTGSLDDVRIYNRVLSATEIATMARGYLPGTGVATHTLSGAFTTTTNAGAIVIASGVVTGSSAITCEGDWLNYGGRFTGTGLVTLTGGNPRTLLSGGQPFRNLTIDAGGIYTLADRLWISETPGVAGTGVLTLVQGQSINGGGWNVRAGRVDDQTLAGTGFQNSTEGMVVLDGSSSQDLNTRNFCGLRIEDPTETGLVGYWKLDQGQGTAVRDEITTANAGTMSATGVTWSAPSTTIGFDNNAAMTFASSGSGRVQATATGLPNANVAQTISVWANFPSAAAPAKTMLALTGTIRLGLSGGNVQVVQGASTLLAQATAPSAGAWHHIAYVYDPSQATTANRDRIYIDGTVSAGLSVAHISAVPSASFIGATSAAADFFTGSLDDVRVYNTALTATQVKQLSLGRYAGTGGTALLTMAAANTTIPANLMSGCNGGLGLGFHLDSGSLYTSTFNLTSRLTTSPVQVNGGTLHIGSGIVNFDGGLTINPMGTLLMDEAGQFQPGVNSTVTIDGTFTASNAGAIIQRDNGGERYAFKVGSIAGVTPVLNITGLGIRDVDANGLQINANTGAVTTFTRFDNIAFRRGTGTYLNIYSTGMFLTSSGCSFGVPDNAGALPTNAVTLTGNGTTGGETRAIFGATCHTSKTTTTGSCQDAWALDDDLDDDGLSTNPATNGAVVQFTRAATTDTAGSIEGFPTSAFDWNTFAYYSTYVAYHDASGTADRIYVRDQAGVAKYQWDTPASQTIIGTPRWVTTGTTHYVFVALASGTVYRLVDTGAALVTDSTWGGAVNPFNCTCTIVTPLTMDASNIYFGGTRPGPLQRVWIVGQTAHAEPMGAPFPMTPALTAASPGSLTIGSTTYLFFGTVGNIIMFNASTHLVEQTNTNPGLAAVRGRVLATLHSRVFAGDDAGRMWAVDPNNFAGTNRLWSYTVPGSDPIQSAPYYDYTGQILMFGTDGGKVVALNSSGAVLTAAYPFVPGSATDSIRTALLYANGVVAVGTTTGKLFFIDRNNGTTGPARIRQYYFGPTEAVSGIGYDSAASRYMVSTADPGTNNGRLYYIDVIADPTPSTL